MKKILVFLFCLISLQTMAQPLNYVAKKTELYEKNYNGKWVNTVSNDDLNIMVTFNKNTITIDAQNNTAFHIYYDTRSKHSDDDFIITSYRAIEIVNQRPCRIDIINSYNNPYTLLSVVYEETRPAVNLRYYLLNIER